MDLVSIAIAIFFFVMAYVLFDKFVRGDNAEDYNEQNENISVPSGLTSGYRPTNNLSTTDIPTTDSVPSDTVKEVVYTQDYYPWWRSTRWWNYDGWLYQKPYYNYWRRPNYYNYWTSGRPEIVGGKRYFKRQFW